jgi:hypothetical protein
VREVTDPSKLRIEYENSEVTLRVYGGHPDNYVAFARISVEGDRGILKNAIGTDFFVALSGSFEEILERCNVRTLEGYVTPVRARMLRMQARGRAEFEQLHTGISNGREMVWVVLSRLTRGEKR